MAGVSFRRLAQALVRSRGTGIPALLSSSRAASGGNFVGLGPYPKTPEERAAAAKKYNMRLEDYEPYPDKGEGYGDYPMLPDRSQQERDPWYEWDHPDLRRNWGEPMHYQFDMYTRNRVDTSPTDTDWITMNKHFYLFLGSMLLILALGAVFPVYQPVAPKQFPFNDLHVERGGDPDKAPEEVKNYEI